MPEIRPISELRNNFTGISKFVHETNEPIYLTKNGYGDMVVMSVKAYEDKIQQIEVYYKLKEAELEAKTNATRYGHADVMSELRQAVNETSSDHDI